MFYHIAGKEFNEGLKSPNLILPITILSCDVSYTACIASKVIGVVGAQ